MNGDHWYYLQDDVKKGPYSSTQIKKMLQLGDLSPESYVWNDSQNAWLPIEQTVLAASPAASEPGMPPTPVKKANIPSDPRPTTALHPAHAKLSVALPLLLLLRPATALNQIFSSRSHPVIAFFLLVLGMMTLLFQVLRLEILYAAWPGPIDRPTALAAYFFIAVLLALLAYYPLVWLLNMCGALLGGQANSHEIRIAMGWALVPVMSILACWLGLLLIYDVGLLARNAEFFPDAPDRIFQFLGLLRLITWIGLALALFTSLRLLSIMQQFSPLASGLNILLATAMLMFPCGGLYAILISLRILPIPVWWLNITL